MFVRFESTLLTACEPLLQLKEYPAALCSLTLSLLDLSNNDLAGLPAELGKPAISCRYCQRLCKRLLNDCPKEGVQIDTGSDSKGIARVHH